MHYFMFLDLPGFYVREWTIREPERGESPLAVHRDKRVIDLNEHAHEVGVRLGMRVDEAKLLLPGMGLILFEEEPYRGSQSKWLDALAEFTSVVEPCDPHSAWADLTGHPDPYDILTRIADRIHRVIGLVPRTGISSAKWVARRAAMGRERPIASADWVDRPATCLAPLPTSALDPVAPKDRERLKFLGYRTIGAVAEIPLRTLKSQFGEAAMTIHSAANGRDREPVRAEYPPDSIVLKRTYDGGLTNLEEVRNAVAALAKAVAFALSQRSSQGTKVAVRVELENRFVDRKRTFSRPIRTTREAMSALSRLIGEPNEMVLSMTVRMPDLVKAEERQAGLFAVRTPGDDIAAKRAVDRVREVFGDRSVLRASEVVVPRRVRVLRAWSHATGWK